MLVLNKSCELLDFLKNFESKEALQYGGGACGARYSYRKVDGLMELLQDRRRAVDQCLAQQIRNQEVNNRISEWERQEQKVSDLIEECTRTNQTNMTLGKILQNESVKFLHYCSHV